MEKLHCAFAGQHAPARFDPILVGAVGSGNLEVMVEPGPGIGTCAFDITTSARGFGTIWEAVLRDFHDRHRLSDVVISINDMGATPAVVSLRLDQSVAQLGRARR